MMNPFDFSGKKYLVTGCTSGIGFALAKKLSMQGASLILLGKDEEKLLNLSETIFKGGNYKYYVKDFATDSDFRDVFDDAVLNGQKLDGLIHCAAIANVQPLSSISIEKLEESMKINLYSFVELIKMFMKRKYHNSGSSIVGISSTSALYPEKGNAIYVATKAAMNAMVQSFAKELVKKDIRINTVMPAFVDTPMLRRAALDSETIGINEKKYTRQLLGLSTPDEIAGVVMFLLSDAAKVITGRAVYADGGDLNFDI